MRQDCLGGETPCERPIGEPLNYERRRVCGSAAFVRQQQQQRDTGAAFQPIRSALMGRDRSPCSVCSRRQADQIGERIIPANRNRPRQRGEACNGRPTSRRWRGPRDGDHLNGESDTTEHQSEQPLPPTTSANSSYPQDGTRASSRIARRLQIECTSQLFGRASPTHTASSQPCCQGNALTLSVYRDLQAESSQDEASRQQEEKQWQEPMTTDGQ